MIVTVVVAEGYCTCLVLTEAVPSLAIHMYLSDITVRRGCRSDSGGSGSMGCPASFVQAQTPSGFTQLHTRKTIRSTGSASCICVIANLMFVSDLAGDHFSGRFTQWLCIFALNSKL